MNNIDQLIDTYFPIPKTHPKRKYACKENKAQSTKSTWEMLPNIKLKPKSSNKKRLLLKYYKLKYYKIIRMALLHDINIFFAEELIGCSITEFKQHIEKLWRPWMNWNNYGKKQNGWVIDHIYPCHIFSHF